MYHHFHTKYEAAKKNSTLIIIRNVPWMFLLKDHATLKTGVMMKKILLCITGITLHFIIYYRGANLSPFGEIRRFHLEIGHSRESCRSVKKKKKKKKNWGGGGGVVVVSASHLCHVTCSVFSPCWQGMVPPYSASDWLTLMSFPHPTNLTPEA